MRVGQFFLLIPVVLSQYVYSQDQRYSFTENKMGSPFSIVLFDRDSVHASFLAKKSFARVDSLVRIFSDYRNDSELNQLCRSAGTGRWFHCSPALFELMVLSYVAFKKSKHMFDVTVGPVTHAWRKARKENIFLASDSVKSKLKLKGFDKVQFDQATHSILLNQKGMQIDFGGIAQGYIAQQVINFLKSEGINNALVNVSGDIVCIGKPIDKKGWTVAINYPESETELLSKTLTLTNCAVTTSGDVYQFIIHHEKKYSHIVDPKTGYGITSQRNVTVIAPDGTLADWLTKACSILSTRQAKKLADSLHAYLLIVELKKGKLIFHSSKNFAQHWTSDSNPQL